MADEVQELVSTDWLADRLGSDDLVVLDASWYLPAMKRNPREEFLINHIAGANFFDINAFSDPDHQLPHMVPKVEQYSSELQKLGVVDGDHVVFYDGHGMFSAARAWWLLKLFGFSRVSVLNGGLPKWIAENKPVSSENVPPDIGQITAGFKSELVCDWKMVKSYMVDSPKQIVDARPSDRFSGRALEPRPGLRSGHIPGSTNICYKDLLNEDNTFKSVSVLLNTFQMKGVDLNLPIITSCGSGVTAAIISLALDLIGAKNIALYDGSWSEWGLRDDLEVEADI